MLAVAGLVFMASGYGRILRGRPIFTNWQGFAVSADYEMFLGAICLLAAVIPWGRIGFLRKPGRENHRR